MKSLVKLPANTMPAFLIGGPLDGSVLHMPAYTTGAFTVRDVNDEPVIYAAAGPLQGGVRNWRVVQPSRWTIRFKTGLAKCPLIDAVVTARRRCAEIGKAEELVCGMSYGLLPFDLSEPLLVSVAPLTPNPAQVHA